MALRLAFWLVLLPVQTEAQLLVSTKAPAAAPARQGVSRVPYRGLATVTDDADRNASALEGGAADDAGSPRLTAEEKAAIQAGKDAKRWSGASIAACVLVGILLCCLPCCSTFVLTPLLCYDTGISMCGLKLLGNYEKGASWGIGRGHEEYLAASIIAEARLGFALPWLIIGIGIWAAATFEIQDVPSYVQLAIIGVVFTRSCVVDVALLRSLTFDFANFAKFAPTAAVPFMLSKLEAVDAVSDGLAVVSVFVLEQQPIFQERLEASWGAGPFGRLFAPVVLRMGLYGVMMLALAAATSVQHLVAMFYVHDGFLARGGLNVTHPSAEAAGFGATATFMKQLRAEDDEPRWNYVTMRNEEKEEKFDVYLFQLGRVAYEGCMQFFLQGSAVLASGTGILGEPTLAISMAISGLLMGAKGAQMVYYVVSQEKMECVWRIVTGFPAFLVFVLVSATMARLVLSELCCQESRLYDIGSWQCVAAPAPEAEPIPVMQWLLVLAAMLLTAIALAIYKVVKSRQGKSTSAAPLPSAAPAVPEEGGKAAPPGEVE